MKKGTFVPPSKRRRRRKIGLRLMGCALIIAALLIIVDHKLYPLIQTFSQAQAEVYVNKTINDAVNEYLQEADIHYDDLIILSTSADGSVDSIQANTVEINQIKVSVIDKVKAMVSANDQTVVGIPIGNLTGSSYLAGRGPCIQVKLKMTSNVSAAFESSFTSAGINQTLHTINLKVTANVAILLPYGRTDAAFSTDYLIGQTVIAGAVPDAYTYVNEVGTDEQTDNIIQDYGAETQTD